MPTVESALTASAILRGTRWQDTFTRTVAQDGWGSDYSITYLSAGKHAWVDGSVGRVSAAASLDLGVASSDARRVEWGFIEFDFYVPANVADTRPYIWISQGGAFPFAVEVYESSGSTWETGIYYYYAGSTDPYTTFVPLASTWYRVKGVFESKIDGLMGIKVWKASDPEPMAFQTVGTVGPTAVPDTPPFDTLVVSLTSPTAEELAFDNLVYGDYGAVVDAVKRFVLTAGAIKRKAMPTTSAALDAWIIPRQFSAAAWIIGGRSGHSRLWDHYGTEPDTVVVLDGAIGPYPSGTTVHVVLADLLNRIVTLESGYHVVGSFSAAAWIASTFSAAALIKRTQSNPYTVIYLNAVIIRGKTNQLISCDALISKPVPGEFTAAAYIIDLVC